MSESLQEKLFLEGLDHVKVVGLNERKFLLQTKNKGGWNEQELEKIS